MIKVLLMTWIPPVVFVKFKFIVLFNSLSPVYLLSFPKTKNRRDGSERLKSPGPADRHYLLSSPEVHASVASLGLKMSQTQASVVPMGSIPSTFSICICTCI